MNRNSLKFRIPFIIMVFAVGCVLITGWLFQYVITENIEVNTLNKNLIISRMISDQISIYVEDAKSTVVTAANFSSQSYGDVEEIKREIFRIYDNFDYFDLIFYMNAEARMVFSKPSNDHVQGRSYTDRSYYWDVMEYNRAIVSPLLISSVLGEPHFIIAAPVYNSRMETIGLIGAGLPLANIQKVIEKTQKHFDGKIWITDEEGVIAVDPDLKHNIPLAKLQHQEALIKGVQTEFASILEKKEETIASYLIEEQEYYGAITFVPNLDWMVVVEQDDQTVFLEVLQLKEQLKSILVIVVFLALIVGLILARKITIPIETLVNRVRRLRYGLEDLEPIPLNPTAKDEIGELSKAFNDMTLQLEKNVEELKREDRIRTLGELSASIIHDIGNPLAGMGSLVEIVKEDIYDADSKKEALNVLEEEIQDLNKLVVEFLEFSRSTKLEKEKNDIHELIDSIVYLLRPEILNKEISIEKNYSNSAPLLMVDRRTIKQALINILKNAMQAMEKQGVIHITTKVTEEHMVITIRDNGSGISDENLGKIFNPFYTTKKDGTGLGLPIAYKLIKEHGGQIDIESRKGKGTEVHIVLPSKGLDGKKVLADEGVSHR